MAENETNQPATKSYDLLVSTADMTAKTAPMTFSTAAKDLITLAIPNTLTFVLQNLADLATLYFIGLIGDPRYTGVVGLGLTWYNIAAYSIVLGFCSVIDTFVPQSFGNGQFADCGICYYRGAIIVLLTCLPFSLLLYCGGPLLGLIGIDSVTAGLAGEYAKLLIPNLFLTAQYELLRKFLNAQKIATPTTAVTVIATVLHPAWCYICIFHVYSGSYLGAALAKTVTTLVSIVLLWCYVKVSGCCKETLPPFDFARALKGWKPFVLLAIPSALMICLDWWAYEVMNVMAGIIGAEELSVNVALVQINLLFFMIPVGIGSSACTFVGNRIGAGDIHAGKFYILVGLGLNWGTIAGMALLLLIFRYPVAYYFFHNEGIVIDLFSNVVYILLLAEIFDTAQGMLGRVLVGMRMQHAATAAVIIAYYFIMIPAGYVFLFILHKGLHGLWYANGLAASSLAAIYVYIILKADWSQLVLEAQKEAAENKDADTNNNNP